MDNIKSEVKAKYGEIAKNISNSKKASCCASSCCSSNTTDTTCYDEISSSDIIYKNENFDNLPKEAIEASLGCGNPVVLANLKEGEIVLDLGSGGGINVLMSAKHVGPNGKVYGLDMTDEMLALANENKKKMNATNVEFLKGYIEDIPLENESIDVIISNCVINLSDDKSKALSEAYRVLKNNGRIAISDIVTIREVPEELRHQAELWCGCIAGTINIDEYTKILSQCGFKNIEINPEHVYTKSVVENLISNKDVLKRIDLNLLDGAFAGAYIKATK